MTSVTSTTRAAKTAMMYSGVSIRVNLSIRCKNSIKTKQKMFFFQENSAAGVTDLQKERGCEGRTLEMHFHTKKNLEK